MEACTKAGRSQRGVPSRLEEFGESTLNWGTFEPCLKDDLELSLPSGLRKTTSQDNL